MDNSILGCFFKVGFDPNLNERDFKDLADTFRAYIWSDKGIDNFLRKLEHQNYGKDLVLILLEFYVKPTPLELQRIKEIGSYGKNEKSIGVPIVVTDENFFSKSEEERHLFLKQSIFKKLELLAEVVKKKKLDTNMWLLKWDLEEVLDGY